MLTRRCEMNFVETNRTMRQYRESSVWRRAAYDEKNELNKPVLGLDFGTSNSCIAVWRPDKDRVKIIRNTSGVKITPSTLRFNDDDGSWTVGVDVNDTSSSSGAVNPVLRGLKSLIGCSVKEASQLECSTLVAQLLAVEESGGDQLQIKYQSVRNKQQQTCTLEELIAKMLSYLKHCAERYLEKKPIRGVNRIDGTSIDIIGDDGTISGEIDRVVIGTPLSFTEHQKGILRSAASLAGFHEVHFMVESTAAAMAYGLLVAGTKSVMVVDIGGGTTDVSIMRIAGDGSYHVEASTGHRQLGGDVIDEVLLQHVKERLCSELGIMEENIDATDLLLRCRHCKEQLSFDSNVILEVPRSWLSITGESAHQLIINVTEFNSVIQYYAVKLRATISSCLAQWKQRSSGGASIDEVVLVGGSSRIPLFRHVILEACEDVAMKQEELCTAVNAEHTVAEGLAIRGAVLQGINVNRLRDLLLLDSVPNTIGILSWTADVDSQEERYFQPIITRGSSIPASGSVTLTLASATQRKVSLEIFEELEEYDIASSNNNSDHNNISVQYSYHFIVSTDASIPDCDTVDEGSKQVKVTFHYSFDGVLKFEVCRQQVTNAAVERNYHEQVDNERSSHLVVLLICYALAMIVMYLIAKIGFAQHLSEMEFASVDSIVNSELQADNVAEHNEM